MLYLNDLDIQGLLAASAAMQSLTSRYHGSTVGDVPPLSTVLARDPRAVTVLHAALRTELAASAAVQSLTSRYHESTNGDVPPFSTALARDPFVFAATVFRAALHPDGPFQGSLHLLPSNSTGRNV